MKNKLGPCLAVGITALCAAAVSITALIVGQPGYTVSMAAPVGVALLIMFGDGWK